MDAGALFSCVPRQEVTKINIAISSLSYNIGVLLHVASDFIIPHYADSRRAFTDCEPQPARRQYPILFVASHLVIGHPARQQPARDRLHKTITVLAAAVDLT
jgi:hypothetical protein